MITEKIAQSGLWTPESTAPTETAVQSHLLERTSTIAFRDERLRDGEMRAHLSRNCESSREM